MTPNTREVEELVDRLEKIIFMKGAKMFPSARAKVIQELQKALEVQAIQIREEEANEYNKIIEREVQKAREDERERMEAIFEEHVPQIKRLAMTECKNKANHTPSPDGYLQWHAWAKQKAKTHKQIRCTECRLYEIWVPRKNHSELDQDKQ